MEENNDKKMIDLSHLDKIDSKLTPFYILKDKKVIQCSLKEYIEYISENDTNIKKTTIGNVLISTVFIGLGSAWYRYYPLVFETMIFGGQFDYSQWKNETYDEALKQHEKACELVKKGR